MSGRRPALIVEYQVNNLNNLDVVNISMWDQYFLSGHDLNTRQSPQYWPSCNDMKTRLLVWLFDPMDHHIPELRYHHLRILELSQLQRQFQVER